MGRFRSGPVAPPGMASGTCSAPDDAWAGNRRGALLLRPPTRAPLVRVESGQRLTHLLRFTDTVAMGSGRGGGLRRGKPPGTIGAEVRLALTPTGQSAPPLGDSYKFLSVSSRGNLQADFPSAEADKTAYNALRRVSTRGEMGPWSEVAAATVAA